MANHVENDAAAVFGAIIPRRPLRFLPISFEDPIAELAAHREHAAEESGIAQEGEFLQARQEQLVLHHAVLEPLAVAEFHDRNRLFEVGCGRLFAIDVLAGVKRSGQQPRPRLRSGGIEEHRVFLVGQGCVEVGGPAFHSKSLGERFDLRRIAADQNRIGHHAIAIGQLHTALIADRNDRANQMLVEAHAAGDTVHDHAEALCRHSDCSCKVLAFGC